MNVHLESVYQADRRLHVAEVNALRDPTIDKYTWDELTAFEQDDAVYQYEQAQIGPPRPNINDDHRKFIHSLQYCKPLIAGFGPPLYNKFNICPCSSRMAGFHTMHDLSLPTCTCTESMDPNQLVLHFHEHKDCVYHQICFWFICGHFRKSGTNFHYAFYPKDQHHQHKVAVRNFKILHNLITVDDSSNIELEASDNNQISATSNSQSESKLFRKIQVMDKVRGTSQLKKPFSTQRKTRGAEKNSSSAHTRRDNSTSFRNPNNFSRNNRDSYDHNRSGNFSNWNNTRAGYANANQTSYRNKGSNSWYWDNPKPDPPVIDKPPYASYGNKGHKQASEKQPVIDLCGPSQKSSHVNYTPKQDLFTPECYKVTPKNNESLGKKLPPIDSINGDNLIHMDSSSMSVSSGSKRGATDDVEDQAKVNHRINRRKKCNLALRKKNKKTLRGIKQTN